MLKNEDRLEELLYRSQTNFNCDADIKTKDPELLILITVEDACMIRQIDEWRQALEKR